MIHYLTEEKDSWIIVKKNFYKSIQSKINKINKEKPNVYHTIKIFDKEVNIQRYQQAYGKSYTYSGNTSESKDFIPLIEKIKNKIKNEITNLNITELNNSNNDHNMCLVNWYMNGNHYIGPHSDDEKQLVKNHTIASLTWG